MKYLSCLILKNPAIDPKSFFIICTPVFPDLSVLYNLNVSELLLNCFRIVKMPELIEIYGVMCYNKYISLQR